jgi:hypothetical protein
MTLNCDGNRASPQSAPRGGRREKDSSFGNRCTIPRILKGGPGEGFGGYVVVFAGSPEETCGTLNERSLGGVFSISCNDAAPENVQ